MRCKQAGVPQQKVAPACVGSAKPPDSRAGTANLGKDKAAAAAAAAKSAANKPKLREGTSVPAAQGAMPKIVIKQGGQHISAGMSSNLVCQSRMPAHLSSQWYMYSLIDMPSLLMCQISIVDALHTYSQVQNDGRWSRP